jgi:hypothetical protein
MDHQQKEPRPDNIEHENMEKHHSMGHDMSSRHEDMEKWLPRTVTAVITR